MTLQYYCFQTDPCSHSLYGFYVRPRSGLQDLRRSVLFTHGLLCPSPGMAFLSPLPKYVKVNPSSSAVRSASMLFKTGHQYGRGTEHRGSTLWSLKLHRPVSTRAPAAFFCSSSCVVEPQMSLPVVLPGSCCPVTGSSQLAEPSYRNRPRGLSASSRIAGGGSRLLLPGRPLLSLGLLQLLLGGSMVALSLGALSLSTSPPVRNSCPFWAGSSVSLFFFFFLLFYYKNCFDKCLKIQCRLQFTQCEFKGVYGSVYCLKSLNISAVV